MNSSAAIHFDDDDGRREALLLHNTAVQVVGGKTGDRVSPAPNGATESKTGDRVSPASNGDIKHKTGDRVRPALDSTIVQETPEKGTIDYYKARGKAQELSANYTTHGDKTNSSELPMNSNVGDAAPQSLPDSGHLAAGDAAPQSLPPVSSPPPVVVVVALPAAAA